MICFDDDAHTKLEFGIEALDVISYMAAESKADLKACDVSAVLFVLHAYLEHHNKQSRFVADSNG